MWGGCISAVVACCVKAHALIGNLGLSLQGVGESSSSQFVGFVANLFAIPCFKLSNALFPFIYSHNQRQLSLLVAENKRLARLLLDPSAADAVSVLVKK